MIDVIYVSAGGFLGAISRYAVNRHIQLQNGFPIGTLLVNLLGAFLLGLIVGMDLKGNIYSLLGIGFMGSFTTFSTLNLEAIQLKNTKKILYLAISYAGGLFLAFCGIALGHVM